MCCVIGGVSLTRLAQRAGRTPFYAYDRRAVTARIALLRRHVPPEIKIHYAIKANPMPALVCHMATLVDGLDVASGGELLVALDAGMAPREISFAGPGKSEGELAQAIASAVLINVESPREIDLLARLSREARLPARVAIRVNPDFELKSSGMKMGGGPKQFGIDAEAIPALLGKLPGAGLILEGFHIYCGSGQNLRSEAICEAQHNRLNSRSVWRESPRTRSVCSTSGAVSESPIFLGNSPSIWGRSGEPAPTCGKNERSPSRRPNRHRTGPLSGRRSRRLRTPGILDRKVSRGQVYLVTDGGLHQHLAASGNFGQVLRKNYPVAIGNRFHGTTREIASVVGPLCTPLDLLAIASNLPRRAPVISWRSFNPVRWVDRKPASISGPSASCRALGVAGLPMQCTRDSRRLANDAVSETGGVDGSIKADGDAGQPSRSPAGHHGHRALFDRSGLVMRQTLRLHGILLHGGDPCLRDGRV